MCIRDREFMSLVQCPLEFAPQLRQLLLPKHRDLLTLSCAGLCDSSLVCLIRCWRFRSVCLSSACWARQPADNKAEIAQTAVQVPFAFEWFHIVPPILC